MQVLHSTADSPPTTPPTNEGPTSVTAWGFTLDLVANTITAGGHPVRVTPMEYAIFKLLFLSIGTVVAKAMLLDYFYSGKDEPKMKVLDVVMCKLRKKLAKANGGEQCIESVWGRGFVIRDPTNASDETASGPCECTGKKSKYPFLVRRTGTIVRLPDGCILTTASLPPPDTRWIASRKNLVVEAVIHGVITVEMAAKRYALSRAELNEWIRQRLFEQGGPRALRATVRRPRRATAEDKSKDS